LIISRTPFRISFFGGGTDYPRWFEEHGGAVLATTINKYCYITCRYLPPFFDHNSRIVWSKIETVKYTDEIQHPAVREILNFMKISEGVEIHHDADLPARTGLGSSSSFSVGLLHSLYALKEQMVTKERLAQEAIHIEQNLLKENVGSQDQISASYGGFNKIEFKGRNKFLIEPVILNSDKLRELQRHIMFFFTGISRTASEIAKEQVENIPERTIELKAMHDMVYEAVNILSSGSDVIEFGKLLQENWKLKKSLSSKVSTPYIDEIYESAYESGAIGGKLCGAGGGGFILFFVPPEKQEKVREKLKNLLYVPIRFENLGSQIIFYQQNKITSRSNVII